MEVQLTSTLTCPQCNARTTHTMPQDACVIVAHCAACGATMRPKLGDCCVFCSYGNVPCPPIQRERADEDDLERLVMAHTPRLRQLLDEAAERIKQGGGIPHDEFWQQVTEELETPG